MEVYKLLDENQKKVFNDSSIVQYGDSNYIYPYASILKDVENSSINRYYKGYVREKMINIHENDDRVLEMIEKMHNKKALELIKKEKERQKEKLLLELNGEVENKNVRNKFSINLSNYKQKLKNNLDKSEHGENILYLLMELLLNRPKPVMKNKINKKLEGLYSVQNRRRDYYSNKLNKIIGKSNNNSQINKSPKRDLDLNSQKKDFSDFKFNTYRKDKSIQYELSSMRKSKSLSDLKPISKKYLPNKNIIDYKRKTDFLKKQIAKNLNEIGIPPLIDNNNRSSINKEKINNINNLQLYKDNILGKNESFLFKNKLEKNPSNTLDNISLNFSDSQRKIFERKNNYINIKKLENLKKKLDNKNSKNNELFINIQDKTNDSIIPLQKNKRNILLNLKKISSKAEEISQHISSSYRSDKRLNSKDDIKDSNCSDFLTKRSSYEKNMSKITKEEKENMVKYNPNNIIYDIKSNYILSQTNRHFFGANKGMDAIDLFKQNLSSEIRKQFIEKDRNLIKLNLKKIFRKFRPHYKFFH